MIRELLSTRARVAGLAVAVLAAVLAGSLVGPWPASLSGRATGDADLAADVRDATTGKSRVGLSVAVLEDGRLRQAGLGDSGTGRPVTAGTGFEIGSVTKTLTASLFADMVADGVVRPDDKVRDVLDGRRWEPGGIGDATLAQLASHRSGLPKVPLSPSLFLHTFGYNFLGTNPYAGTEPSEVIGAAASSPRPTKGEYAYSNLGFAFLGQVLAEKAGMPYRELLRQRVLDPTAMDATTIPATEEGVPRGAAAGHDGTGRRVEPWVSRGSAPAGTGVWSTTGDLARFADRVMRGTAPGSAAAKARYGIDGSDRIGYAWVTSKKAGGGSIVWHNGVAGGCAAFLGFDRAAGRVVVVLGNTDVSVDAIGMHLLVGSTASQSGSSGNPVARGVGLALPPIAGLSVVSAVLGGLRPRRRSTPDRAGVIGGIGWSVFMFTVAHVSGAVGVLSVAAWLLGAALLGAGVFAAAVRWRHQRWNVAARRRLHWAGSAAGVLVGLAVAAAVALAGAL